MEEAGAWLAGIEAGEFDLPLDELISSGAKHLFILETCASCVGSSDSSHQLSVSKCMDPIANWIGRWEAAAVEAESLGLGRDTSYKYWQKNIELPEVVERACKWFDTAERLAQAVDVSRLMKFATDGRRHIEAVRACLSIPKFRRWSIQRSFVKWSLLVVRWVDQAQQAEGPESPDDSTTLEIITLYERMKMERRAKKADRLKKRTCSHCGKKASLSQLSFAYCGGCRHSGVAREHWARYCSEACQHAHWAAGHKDECPCARDL